ncbi:MAG: glycosyltransferase family 2 protein [Bacteroidetes bacterium]|nr:glycosyltransferase family 2 protein [Bacteroidota bacterium]
MRISIILPVYNPSAGWAEHAINTAQTLREHIHDADLQFIIVNDGSDSEIYRGGKEQITEGHIQLIEYAPNKGKGEALRQGVAAADGDMIVYTDIDFPYTIASIADVIEVLRSDRSDVVIGVKDRSYYDRVPWFRRFASKSLRSVVRLFFRIPTDDFMCGLKGFNIKGKEVFMNTVIRRYLFDLDFMVLLAQRQDVRIETLEVHLRENVSFRKMNPRMILSELRDLARIWLRS